MCDGVEDVSRETIVYVHTFRVKRCAPLTYYVSRETMLILQFMFHVKRHSTIITVMRCQFSPNSVRHVVL